MDSLEFNSKFFGHLREVRDISHALSGLAGAARRIGLSDLAAELYTHAGDLLTATDSIQGDWGLLGHDNLKAEREKIGELFSAMLARPTEDQP